SGVKKTDGRTRICDMMRGEETETVGLASVIESDGDKVFVLPGTHNKIVHVSRDGMITDCVTTFSGELLDNIISNTILAGQVSHDFQIIESEVLKGAAYAKENGLNAALFKIRVMAKNGIGVDALSSFLYGCVIGEDICLINRIAQGKKIYVFGRKTLREVYAILLGEDAVLLDDDVCSSAMVNGAMLVKQIYDAHSRRKTIIERIEKEKVIAIVRNAEKESCVEAMRALYDGGIRLAEVTFDRSGKKSVQEIAEMIRMLVSEFGNDMCIGAGTVTRTAEVFAAFEAGASYIISPNCDPEIISLTRKLGMVSMPAAYTATEITAAMNHGADYVKLFPADQVSEDYVKAVCAPLSDAKLFAVGGVNADNASKFLKMGFCGIGVGSNLYDKKLIAEKNFDALRELAKKYSSLSKSNDID
ncbi:MAG: bifunctional 4-hydroxy-2-oxoglutarate aldolase/2-dehydro-3-deoxy-phosphogluconate aldolase, partial [Clostridia bacterium]|nr:bifunctional 4-hydroxy-2-oxoglutarate aldolase/2-dehydro-3-deoxy-phosphogluconate aldolase [Clostridia bacterium]